MLEIKAENMEKYIHITTEYHELLPLTRKDIQRKLEFNHPFDSGILKDSKGHFHGNVAEERLLLIVGLPSTYGLFFDKFKIKIDKFEVLLQDRVVLSKTLEEMGHMFRSWWNGSGWLPPNALVGDIEKFDTLKVTYKFDFLMDLKEALQRIQRENQISTKSQLFSFYYGSDFLSDFILSCEDKQFKVHRMILSMSSPVWLKMFESNLKESLEGKGTIMDMKKETLETMLEWIYTGKVDKKLNLEELLELYKACHSYSIKLLQEWCTAKILSKIGIENAEEIKNLGKLYNEAMWVFRADCVQKR